MCVREREIYLSSLHKFYLGFPNFRSFVHNSCLKVLRPHLFTYSSFTYWAPRNLYVYQWGLWMNRLGQLYGLEGLLYVCVFVTVYELIYSGQLWSLQSLPVSAVERTLMSCVPYEEREILWYFLLSRSLEGFYKVFLSGSDPLFTRAWRVEQK